ncbi:MAG: molybdopterin-dependent oxidoreductase, partial [Candidatus Methanoperedens sp.]
MSDNVFPTICPGCNFGCGLYIRENGALEVDFRKSSPANAGKLCRFGMKLPSLFTSVKSMIDGSEAQAQDAAKEAASRLSSGSTAFVSFGNTSSEEHLAFQKFSEKLKVPLYTGVDFDGLPEDTHPTLRVGIPYSEIEAAKHIVLFIDPYTQYPLIVRRLVSAKKRGAKITAVGYKELPIADDNISPDDISQLALTGDSVVIADFHPLSDTGHLKSVLALAGNAGAKLTFLKPFGNSTGAYLVSKDVKQQALSKLVEEIDKGSIDTLFCLESDVLEVIPAEVAGKLKNLIIQTGHNSATAQKANIVIASEPFYRKKGMVVNNEGRVQALGGGEVSGIALLGTIAGDSYDFDGLNGEVKSMLGIES